LLELLLQLTSDHNLRLSKSCYNLASMFSITVFSGLVISAEYTACHFSRALKLRDSREFKVPNPSESPRVRVWCWGC